MSMYTRRLIKSASIRAAEARRAQEAHEAARILAAEWHVGMRRGHNANIIYTHDGVDEWHDSSVCEVYRLPLRTMVDEAKNWPGYAVARHIADCHKACMGMVDPVAEVAALKAQLADALALVKDLQK